MSLVDRVALRLAERDKLTQHVPESAAIARCRDFARSIVQMVENGEATVSGSDDRVEIEIQTSRSNATLVPSSELARMKAALHQLRDLVKDLSVIAALDPGVPESMRLIVAKAILL